jgi:hypothetical protein
MQRHKTTAATPTPRPTGNWLAGMMIGSAIVTMAAQAILLGAAGAAISGTTPKRG